MPRPPDTMMRAAASSGRALFVRLRPVTADCPVSATAASASTGALPPVAAGSNAVARTVITLIASFDCTVASALPA
jgi:hypothetical protein